MPLLASPLQPDAAKPEPRSAEAAAEIARALSGKALGHSEEGFWGSLGALGRSWATLGLLLGAPWGHWGHSGSAVGDSLALLGTLWALLGTLLYFLVAPLGDLWVAMCLLGAPFGVLLEACGITLGTFGRHCGHFWRDAAKLRKYKDFFGFPELKDTRGLQK